MVFYHAAADTFRYCKESGSSLSQSISLTDQQMPYHV